MLYTNWNYNKYLTLSVRGTLKYVGRRHDGLIIWRHTFGLSTSGDITASTERVN